MLSSTININVATLEDLRQVKEIDQLLFKDDSYPMFALRQLLDISDGLLKVAVSGTETVGYAIGHFNADKSEAWFLSLGVLPEYRGQQIGERLVSGLMEDVVERGAKRIYLTVHPSNTTGVRIYDKLGFSTHQTDEDYYLDGSPRIVMVKEV